MNYKSNHQCIFCSKDIEIGTGFRIIGDLGNIKSFCSRKCRRNLELKRVPKNVNWIRKKQTSSKKIKDTKNKENENTVNTKE